MHRLSDKGKGRLDHGHACSRRITDIMVEQRLQARVPLDPGTELVGVGNRSFFPWRHKSIHVGFIARSACVDGVDGDDAIIFGEYHGSHDAPLV